MQPSRSNGIVALAFAAIAALGLAGCGYQFAAEGSNLPSDAHTIYVARFANMTRITGINDVFMRYLKDEIALRHRLEMVDSPAHADLELTGRVMNVIALPTSFNSVLEPTIYNQSLTVSAQLKDLRTGKIIWMASNISDVEHQPLVAQAVVPTTPTFVQGNLRGSDIAKMTDIQVAQTQGDLAQNQMMTYVAQNLYASMAEGF